MNQRLRSGNGPNIPLFRVFGKICQPARESEKKRTLTQHTTTIFLCVQKVRNSAGGVYIFFKEYCNNRGKNSRKCLILKGFAIFRCSGINESLRIKHDLAPS